MDRRSVRGGLEGLLEDDVFVIVMSKIFVNEREIRMLCGLLDSSPGSEETIGLEITFLVFLDSSIACCIFLTHSCFSCEQVAQNTNVCFLQRTINECSR